MTLISHIRVKREIVRDRPLPSEFPVPLWPAATCVTAALFVFVVVMVSVLERTRSALVIGLTWIGLIWIAPLALAYRFLVRGPGKRWHELVDTTERFRLR